METIVANIGGLLALCGIASCRSFLPTFLLLAVVRFARGLEGCPQALQEIAAQVPDVMLGDGVMVLFFILAAVELVANWNETVRQLLEDADFDTYFKPFYAFVFSIVAGAPIEAAAAIPAQNVVPMAESAAESVASAVSAAAAAAPTPPAPEEGLPWLAWVWNIVRSGASGFGTWAFCAFRSRIASLLRSIDPDNSFHLHTLSKLAEETTWVAVLLVALLVPALAGLLVAVLMILAAAFRAFLKARESKCSHKCQECGGKVHNSAVICPGCRKDQPVPYRRVGFFALASSAPVDPDNAAEVVRHHRSLLSAHRCPLCASELKDGFVCGRCGTRIWEQGITRRDLVGRLDMCVIVTTIVGVVMSPIPVLGFLVAVAAMNIMAIGVLTRYESRMGRIFGRFIFKVVKWTLLLAAIVLSAYPFAGALFLAPFLVRYLWLRRRFLSALAPSSPAQTPS